MTDRLDEIEARLAAATKGPWFWRGFLLAEGSEQTYAGYPQRILAAADGLTLIAETFDGHPDQRPPHAELIAHAPADLAALVAVARAAKKIHEYQGPYNDTYHAQLLVEFEEALRVLDA